MDRNELFTVLLNAAAGCKENTFSLSGLSDGPIFDPPLLGLARGDDPMFGSLKEIIGPFHWTPEEAWALARPEHPLPAGAITVLSIAMPHSHETTQAQRKEKEHPSLYWVYARNSWPAVSGALCRRLIGALKDRSVDAVAPELLPQFRQVKTAFGHRAVWSQAHVAHIAGLGTFGLAGGLITRRGKGVRLCSLLLEGVWPVEKRPYEGPFDWCLHSRDGACGACAARCPAGAVALDGGFDRKACLTYISGHKFLLGNLPGVDPKNGTGCGLCHTNVPCATRKPEPPERRKT